MRWERPDWAPDWGTFVVIAAGVSFFVFLMMWMGVGNYPGAVRVGSYTIRREWVGDPIPLSEALRRLPAVVAVVCAVLGISFFVTGFRSDGPDH